MSGPLTGRSADTPDTSPGFDPSVPSPARMYSLNNPSRVADSGVVTGHGGSAHAGTSAEAEVTSSSEENLGDRFSTACPLR